MNPHGRTERASMTADDARRMGLIAESWPTEEVLAWGAEQFAPRITLATGFGVEGCVLIDLIARNDLPIDLFTLDTGLLFPETYALWKALERQLRRHDPGGAAGADRGGAGADAGRGAVGTRAGALLRAPQGDAADRHAWPGSMRGSPRSGANRRRRGPGRGRSSGTISSSW